MPHKPLGPCRHAGCPKLTASGYCPAHARERESEASLRRKRELDKARPSAAKCGYDAHWREWRKRILARDSLCRSCRRARSTNVDHIIPLRRGGTNDSTNLQGLCDHCHASKTARLDHRWG